MSSFGVRAHRRWIIAVSLAVVLGLTGMWIGLGQENPAPAQSGGNVAPAAENLGPPTPAGDPQIVGPAQNLSRAFRAAAQRVLPTVVTIRTTTRAHQLSDHRTPRNDRNPFKGMPFEDFFGDRDFNFEVQPFVPRQEGVGSGVIIDPSGIILTNAHVVDDADEVMVGLPDGRQFKATDIKTDEETDLAVLRIKAEEKLPVAILGDSGKMEIGDWVIAIGTPLELEHTVSAGIISAVKRSLPQGKRADYLQTDAAINPGNSGGPLVNLNGEVIGINTAIASSSGGYQGIGFAIPSNLARWVSQQLIIKGSVARAYMGVEIEELTSEVAAKFGVRPDQGVLVTQVLPDAPAAKAGFKQGDVISTYAGEKVHSRHELQELVERSPFGSHQQVAVIRDGRPQSLVVEVQSMPQHFGADSRGRLRENEEEPIYTNRDLGLELSDLTPEIAAKLRLSGASGVLIAAVMENGIAAESGLQKGMVILKVGNTPVNSVGDFEKAMKKQSLKEGVLLVVRTPAGNHFVVLQDKETAAER
jgi:serine protease Do